MEQSFRGLRGLFCGCFVLAAVSVLALNGYALALLAVIGLWILLRRKPLPDFTVILLVGGFALRVALMILVRPAVESDFWVLYEAAQSLLKGDLSFQFSAYFSLWAYQSVFVAWEAMWLWLWNDPRCLVLVNAALASGTVYLVYRMVRGWVEERIAQAAALLLTLFPFGLTLHTVLSNQIPSAFFLTLSLWILAGEDCRNLKFWRFPLAGLFMQIGNLLRTEGVIFLCAALAWGVLECLRHPERLKQMAWGMLTLCVVYFAVHWLAGTLVQMSGLNANGIRNGNPGWKFVTGLNSETSGRYSQHDWDLISATLDENHLPTQETHELQRSMISRRLAAGPKGLARLAVKKIQALWCADGLDWALGGSVRRIGGLFSHQAVYELTRQFDRGLFFLALGLAALGLASKRHWGEHFTEAYLPYLVFFAAFCALMMIEVQPRYAYLPQIFLFAASAFGLERLDAVLNAEFLVRRKGPALGGLQNLEQKREFHEQAEQAD